MSQCVVILGMHRSGTSCLSRILKFAGLELGPDLLNGTNVDNLLGHWESNRVIELNDRLLAASGGSWNAPPAQLVADEDCRIEMRRWISQFDGVPIWGWKDPRTILTFAAWQPLLPQTSIVGCLRNPHAVARSLTVRNRFTHTFGLHLWQMYNQRLLELAQSGATISWYVHGESLQRTAQRLQQICQATGLRYTDSLLELINPHLDHHGHDAPIEDPDCRELYSQLLEMADNQLHHDAPVVAPLSVANAQLSVKETLARSVQQLAEVVKRSDALQQQSYNRVLLLESRSSAGESQAARLKESLSALTDQLAAAHQQLAIVEQENAATQRQVDSLQQQLSLLETERQRDVAFSERRASRLEMDMAALHCELNGLRAFVDRLRQSFPARCYRKLQQAKHSLAARFQEVRTQLLQRKSEMEEPVS